MDQGGPGQLSEDLSTRQDHAEAVRRATRARIMAKTWYRVRCRLLHRSSVGRSTSATEKPRMNQGCTNDALRSLIACVAKARPDRRVIAIRNHRDFDERRSALPFVVSTTVFFVFGDAFGYFVATPYLMQLELELARLMDLTWRPGLWSTSASLGDLGSLSGFLGVMTGLYFLSIFVAFAFGRKRENA